MTIITTHVLHWANACDASVPHCDGESSSSSASSTSKGSIARRGVEARASSAKFCFGAELSPPDKPVVSREHNLAIIALEVIFSVVVFDFEFVAVQGDGSRHTRSRHATHLPCRARARTN